MIVLFPGHRRIAGDFRVADDRVAVVHEVQRAADVGINFNGGVDVAWTGAFQVNDSFFYKQVIQMGFTSLTRFAV